LWENIGSIASHTIWRDTFCGELRVPSVNAALIHHYRDGKCSSFLGGLGMDVV
jgi:hypothetical protein